MRAAWYQYGALRLGGVGKADGSRQEISVPKASKTFAGWRFAATLLLTAVGTAAMAAPAAGQAPTPNPDPLKTLLQNLIAPLAPILTQPSQPPGPANGGVSHQSGAGAVPQAAIPPNPEVRCGGTPAPLVFARTPGRTTQALVDAAGKQVGGAQTLQAVLPRIAPPFPVAGPASYRDDWGEPRSTPCPHLHQGNDIFAALGTPFVAPEGGVVTGYGFEGVGGNCVYFSGDDGYSFYGAHLDGFGPALRTGVRVTAGTILGYVGNTGDAAGGSPHLHFQLYPPGHAFGSPVDPKFWLDASLNQAIERAGGVVPGPGGTGLEGAVGVNVGALMSSVLTAGGHIITQPTVPVILLVVLVLGALAIAQTRTFKVAVELRRSRSAASVPVFLVSGSAYAAAEAPPPRRVGGRHERRSAAAAAPEKPAERKPSRISRAIRSTGATWTRFPATMSRLSAGSSRKAKRRGRPTEAGSLLALSAGAGGRKAAGSRFARGTAQYAVKRAN